MRLQFEEISGDRTRAQVVDIALTPIHPILDLDPADTAKLLDRPHATEVLSRSSHS